MSQSHRLGPVVADWQPPALPAGAPMEGRHARLERLDAGRHAAPLHAAFEGHDRLWDYMPVGTFDSGARFHDWMRGATARDDMVFHAILDRDAGTFGGIAAYLRMKPAAGSIEVGHIVLAPRLQRTRAATEAMHLMMKWAFEAGYRRYEWKCDALNRPSRRAAQRLGLSFEGIFRQATVVKGRNRDTAWFAAIDAEWPALDSAFRAWLAPGNFDVQGRQRERLSDLTRGLLHAVDPDLPAPGG